MAKKSNKETAVEMPVEAPVVEETQTIEEPVEVTLVDEELVEEAPVEKTPEEETVNVGDIEKISKPTAPTEEIVPIKPMPKSEANKPQKYVMTHWNGLQYD